MIAELGAEYRLTASNATDEQFAGLAHLATFPALELVRLWACPRLTDAGFAHLRYLGGVQELQLRSCDQITGAGLAHLRHLTRLRALALVSCAGITDDCLLRLKDLTRLRTLTVACRQVTHDGLRRLSAALPNCRVN